MSRNGSNPPPMAPNRDEPRPRGGKVRSGHYFPREGKKAMTRLLIFAGKYASCPDFSDRRCLSASAYAITVSAAASVSVWKAGSGDQRGGRKYPQAFRLAQEQSWFITLSRRTAKAFSVRGLCLSIPWVLPIRARRSSGRQIPPPYFQPADERAIPAQGGWCAYCAFVQRPPERTARSTPYIILLRPPIFLISTEVYRVGRSLELSRPQATARPALKRRM